MRLIDADALMTEVRCLCDGCNSNEGSRCESCEYDDLAYTIEIAPTVDAVALPCKVGDEVWCVRDTRVYNKPVKGTVTEIYFRDNMDMCIVVRRLCRGRWGERIFATEKEAQAAIDRRMNNGNL